MKYVDFSKDHATFELINWRYIIPIYQITETTPFEGCHQQHQQKWIAYVTQI